MPDTDSISIADSEQIDVKHWQNFQAFTKVKHCIELLTRQVASNLEHSLDIEQEEALSAEDHAACITSLASIGGVLRMMACQELALLMDEIQGLLEDSLDPAVQNDEERTTEIRQLAFVVLTDFPAIFEGVLSGHIRHWYELSQQFNKIRKARNKSLVFSRQTLLNRQQVDFKRVFASNPAQLRALLDQQLKRYQAIRKNCAAGNSADSLNDLHTLFCNLEVMCRDFRLATLWGLCAAIAQGVAREDANAGHPAVKLLCSFSTIIQMVRDNGTRVLQQNIPEDIFEKIMEVLVMPRPDTGRLLAIRYWYNLDFKLARELRKRNQELLVAYNRKDAFAKAIRILIERAGQVSEQINEAIANGRTTPDEVANCMQELRHMLASARTLGMAPMVALLAECTALAPGETTDYSTASADEITQFLTRCAQSLYQSEQALQRHAQELERAVFVSKAGKQDSTALTGVKLNVVLEAIKNLEQVVGAVNNYAEAEWDSSKLSDVGRLLHGAGMALQTVPVASVAGYCAEAQRFVETRLTSAEPKVNDAAFKVAIDAFAHLIITTIQYLEQMSIGRVENCARLELACNTCCEVLRNADSPPSLATAATAAIDSGFDPVPDAGESAVHAEALPANIEDEELKAVFVEEAAELLLQIDDCHAALAVQPDDTEALSGLRRSYHTLKGSGRMVGAEAVAAIAWCVENLLNKVLGGRVLFNARLTSAISPVRDALPGLIADYHGNAASAFDASTVAALGATIDNFGAVAEPEADDSLPAQGGVVERLDEATGAQPVDARAEHAPRVEDEQEQTCEHLAEQEAEQHIHQAELDDVPYALLATVPQFNGNEPSRDALSAREHQAEDDQDTSGTSGAGQLQGKTASDGLAGLFEVESRRTISCIRAFLDGSVAADADGQAITSTSYLIPVHTMYGNCRVAELQHFGNVVAQLERLLQDYPWRQVDAGLHALLDRFCVTTEKVTAGHGQHVGLVPASELLQDFDSFMHELDAVRMQLSGKHCADYDDDPAQAQSSAVTAQGAENESLLLRGFLHEARTTHACIVNLYAGFKRESACDRDRAGRLSDQFALLEGAAELAGQQAIAGICRELAQAYQQCADGLYAVNESVGVLLDRCHAYVDSSMAVLETGASNNVPADDLQAEFKYTIEQLISLRSAQKQKEAEAEVEDSLLAVFIEEAGEILQDLDSKIADWLQAPDDKTIVDDVLRSLHTLKGSAALVGEKEISESAHDFETCVTEAARLKQIGEVRFFSEVDRHLNTLQLLFALYHTDDTGRVVRRQISEEELASLAETGVVQNSGEPGDAAAATDAAPAQPAANAAPALEAAADAAKNTPKTRSAGQAARNRRVADAGAPSGLAVDEHVRVSSKLLKSLLNDADEISIARNRIEQTIADMQSLMGDMDETLNRFENSMSSFERYAKTGTGLRQAGNGARHGEADRSENAGIGDRQDPAAGKEFDALEMDKYTELQQTVLSLLEDYNDVLDIKNNVSGKLRTMGSILVEQQRSSNKLQEGLVSSQLVPFAGIAPRLRRLVRQVSGELDKQVTIKFGNPEGKIDRSVLQVLVNPIEHMIRNALDHGIESTIERLSSGKQGHGELLVKLFRQGASVILEIADDGRGINTAKVREKAIAQGLLAADAVISEQELCQFILRAGFSTSDTVSRISGRGVGLDVVQDEISQIGGDIEIFSTPGLGTTFRIRLPLTSSLNRALLFTVSGVEYVMLLSTIDGIILEKNARLQQCLGAEEPTLFHYGDKAYELAYLGSLLDEQAMPQLQGGLEASSSLVLVSGSGKNLALHVDSVVGSRELVVKSLGAQFSSIPLLTGGVILGDGRVVVVLDPRFLVDNHVARKIIAASPAPAPGIDVPIVEFEAGKTVMVVDDSITVRKVTSAILRRNGMNVILAKNGMEAVELLQSTRPDIMLLDIEMPKMDGFEVAAYIRRQESPLRDLPIIMITSRIGAKHRSRAEEIGVNQYMCKPFQEAFLLEAIAEYS